MARDRDPKGAILMTLGIAALVGGILLYSSYTKQRDLDALRREGVTGVARVLSYEETGAAVNHVPEMRFRLEITPDRGPPALTVVKDLVVTPMEAPRLQVGSKRKVRYLPRDPQTLTFED